LVDLVGSRLPVSPPLFAPDVLTDRDEPFHAAEIVREKLTLKLARGAAYGINVQIERFADEDNRIMINAVIWVERAGQKAIVIGQGGERLKEIGRLARLELNDLWQRSVHLELWVKVKENWADSEMALRQFGYRHVCEEHAARMAGTGLRIAPVRISGHQPHRGGASPPSMDGSPCSRGGANGPKSALKGVLRPFQRLLVFHGRVSPRPVRWSPRESDGQVTRLAPARLMSGFYLNELLLKLTERRDPHPEIFFLYASCVQALCDGEVEETRVRRFEKRLLNELGYGVELTQTRRWNPGGTGQVLSIRTAKRSAVVRGGVAGRRLRAVAGRSEGGKL